jgi:DNA excision repair protein ERCC-2
MEFSLDHRTASLSVGEFADFSVGPHDTGSGAQGLWRAQLGTQWHQELRRQTALEVPEATFEVAITGRVFHAGWTLTLTGRIDQWVPRSDGSTTLREIKTVTRALPTSEEDLRADYPEYFAQLATYLALKRIEAPAARIGAELLFVETGSGLAQPIPLSSGDEALFRARLERVTEFLSLRLRARERLRGLDFRPPFPTLRPGQETTHAELTAALARSRVVTFEAPTGFGKTGALLECSLEQLRSGRFARLLYLTSKSTGQLQVVRTLAAMTTPPASSNPIGYTMPGAGPGPAVAAWHVRNKGEHCVNHTFHCSRESCAYLQDVEVRWPRSGLSKFYVLEHEPRDLDTLRAAGKAAGICPYEITRTALAFNDVWIGDYNYVFAPRNRSLFYLQPGFIPEQTLLVLDEAHNLPSRVADAHSHVVRAAEVHAVLAELDHQHAPAPLVRAWEAYVQFLLSLPACDALDAVQEDDLADLLNRLGELLQQMPVDTAALDPRQADCLWLTPELGLWLKSVTLQRLLWSPVQGELHFTCLDAAPFIGDTLRSFGGVVLASATIGSPEDFAQAIGLEDGGQRPEDRGQRTEDGGQRPEVRGQMSGVRKQKAEAGAWNGQQSERSAGDAPLTAVVAHTPWRDDAYDIAYDVRVDTTYQQRERHYPTTAATIEALHAAANASTGPRRAVAVFFPSYRYTEAIQRALDQSHSVLRVALQPRLPDLAAQAAWVEESLAFADAIFLVLGSSFAEGIDLLGGRISHAMVVGPALPEVNAVQRARLAACSDLGRERAFRKVYQIPGLQKVNQALGRLVRAPGQRAKVLLHCRRFIEPGYARLLAPDYQFGATITTTQELADWIGE